MITLRDYQLLGIEQLREKFRQGKTKIIFWAATGSGKGLVMPTLASSLIKNGHSVLTVLARREVIFQTDINYKKYYNIESSLIMGANTKIKKYSKSFICSIDTLRARGIESVKHCDYVIIDEAHDCPAPRYNQIFENFKNIFGFTATPFSQLSMFDDYVYPITPKQLRDQGYLTPVKHYSHSQIDTSNVRTIAGDFNQAQLAIAASDSKIVGDIVDTWKKYGENKRTILFAVNKNHSAIMAESFRRAGVSAMHIDESHNKQEREYAVNSLISGSIKILCNIGVYTTGVDIPSVECLILARPTKSEILYIQSCGRGLRPSEGKTHCTILDHSGNIYTHGDVYSDRKINLDGKNKKNITDVKVLTCPACFAVIDCGVFECPYCGHEFIQEKKNREIEHEEGELKLINEQNLFIQRIIKITSEYEKLKRLSEVRNFKPSFKYFKLYEKFGNDIYFQDNKLKIPLWIPKVIEENNKKAIQ